LDNNLVKIFIQLLILNVTSLILLVRKLEGSVRIYINYRGINNICVKNRYPLLLIKKTLDAIYKVK
ncbi:hypothetical protein NEUTE1DRAFT_41912, partial [Neurospora tetrasperma FGSC 2508]